MPTPHDERPVQSLSNDDSDTSNTRQVSAPHYVVPPPPLPPETYNYLIHALLSLQGSASHSYTPPAYSYPVHPSTLSNCHYPWPPTTLSTASESPYLTNSISLPPRIVPQSAGSLQSASPVAFPTTAPTAQDPEGTEDTVSVTEEKRRRNTAASARFRTKKKLKTLNLERTVTDLAGRAEELEREAADLRRENAWLKEIVLLKGRSLTTLNLGSQAPASGNPRDEDDTDEHTHVESEPESTVKLGEQGKDKEDRGELDT